MSRRPSQQTAIATHGLRRRSGAYPGPEGRADKRAARDPEKTLPPLPSPYDNDDQPHFAQTLCTSPTEMDAEMDYEDVYRAFSPVPLTPRVDERYAPTRLPTPDYNEPRRHDTSSTTSSATLCAPSAEPRYKRHDASKVSRGASLISFQPPLPPSMLSLPFTRTHIISRSHSDKKSVYSSRSTNSSVASGRSTLIPAVGTTDRFTHRWPIPRLGTQRKKRTRFNSIDGGDGLGIESPSQWPREKWCLMLSVLTVLTCGVVAMIYGLSAWFRTWLHADVMYVADYDILVLITLGASILLLTSIVGLTGAILNSRAILAVYALLLWPALMAMLAVGYAAYKRSTFSLDHKLSFSWSKYYTPRGRLLIQNALQCCGFYNPLHESVPSRRCYPRTGLPGCKGKLYRFERENLGTVWATTFSLVPLHLFNILVALLCSNHVTETFGKGITPRQYRLTRGDVKADAERLAQVMRPEYSRASSSATFREDRKVVVHYR